MFKLKLNFSTVIPKEVAENIDKVLKLEQTNARLKMFLQNDVLFSLLLECCMDTEKQCSVNYVKERLQNVCKPSKCFY